MTIKQKIVTLLVLWLVEWLDNPYITNDKNRQHLQTIRDLVKGAENV